MRLNREQFYSPLLLVAPEQYAKCSVLNACEVVDMVTGAIYLVQRVKYFLHKVRRTHVLRHND